MAGDYFVPNDTVSAAPARSGKPLKVFIFLGLVFLGGELIWLFGISPFRPFSRIDISGFDGISREEVYSTAGITKDLSFFSVDTEAMERALLSLSFLESARVLKHFPGRLQIILEGRRAVASAYADFQGKTIPVLFDSQGVIFMIGGDETDESFYHQFPVVSGFLIEDPVPGMRLPVMYTPLFDELEKIGNAAPELLSAVSELKIVPRPYDGFDLILYPVHQKIKVRLSGLNEDQLRYALLMVDVLASKEPGTESLDFRSGIGSYIPKEASSE